MAIELVKNKKHLVVKRDGRIEEYDEEKMRKVLKWACNDREWMVDEILNDVQIKIYDKIHITKLFDEVINTVANKISLLYPIWDEVAKNLLIQKYYKEVWGIKRDEYPDYLEVIKKALKYNIYKKEIIETFSEEELKELGSYINPKRDFLFTFGGLELFMSKYAKRYTKNKMLELPQHTYMRVAIQLHYKDKDRLKRIKEKYDMLSLHKIAPATPIMLNSLSDIFNATSCVLIQTDDDSESIMETARSMAIYSKNASGLGVDISRIRALGSSIGKDGVSSGVIPFIKVFESIVSSWNQKCYSEDTEILTENGWKLFSELENEKVAQYVYDGEGNGHIEFVNYVDFFEYDLKEQPMYHFYMNSGRYIDLLVSQNHRMVKLITPSNKLSIEYAKDIEYGSDNWMIVSGGNINKNKHLSNWDKFLIAYQADGGRNKRITGKFSGYYSYYFRFTKKRKIKRLQNLLDTLIREGFDINYKVRINKNGEHKPVTIFDVKVSVDYGVLPKDFDWVDITKYSEQEIDEFIFELTQWDGSSKNRDYSYLTIKKENVDKIQALAVLGNYRTSISVITPENKVWKQQYKISFVKTNKIGSCSISNKENSNRGIRKEKITYTGKIYSVSVPSTILVVRRNGKVVISGNSARVGAAAVYYPFWHLDSERITLLKDAGGNDDERARKLKYAIKWNSVFTDAIINDDYVYLFDPKDTPELLDTYGEEFKKWYKYYSEKQGIRKKKIKARELAYLVAKIRSETGNLYWFSVDNANKFRVTKDFINQGNLCCSEVLLPTKPLKLNKIKFIKDVETGVIKEVRSYDGEIGICNLTSINLLAWNKMNEEEKDKFIYSLLLGMDNAIEYADYPVKAGERFNKLHRAIGIGITNYHNWLASQQIKFSDEKAKEVTHYVMEDIYFYLVKNSIELSKERGKYYYYDGSLWSKGKFGWELYEEYFKEIEKELGVTLNYPLKHNWDSLRVEMVKYGVRFELLMSIPPGATSSAVLNFTEGIEPIRELKITKEGTYTLPFIVPNLQKNRMYYEKAWEIPTKQILELAAIRQKFLDQSQSLNLYQTNPDSAFDIINDIVYAEKLGVKSLYYFNSLKKGDIEEVCEGCAV